MSLASPVSGFSKSLDVCSLMMAGAGNSQPLSVLVQTYLDLLPSDLTLAQIEARFKNPLLQPHWQQAAEHINQGRGFEFFRNHILSLGVEHQELILQALREGLSAKYSSFASARSGAAENIAAQNPKRLTRTLANHLESDSSVQLSGDQNVLEISDGRDLQAIVIQTGRTLMTFGKIWRHNLDRIEATALSPNHKWLAINARSSALSRDSILLMVVDPGTQRIIKEIKLSPIEKDARLQFSADSSLIEVHVNGKSSRVFDLDLEPVYQSPRKVSVLAAGALNDGFRIVTQDKHALKVFGIGAPTAPPSARDAFAWIKNQLAQLKNSPVLHKFSVMDADHAVLSADGARLMIRNDQEISMFDTADGQKVGTVPRLRWPFQNAQISSSQNLAVFQSLKVFEVWDFKNGSRVLAGEAAEGFEIHAIKVSPDGHWVAVQWIDQGFMANARLATVELWEVSSGIRSAGAQGATDFLLSNSDLIVVEPDSNNHLTVRAIPTGQVTDSGIARIVRR